MAVQAEKFLEKSKRKRNRKDEIFRALMATRANRLSERHVEALNMIELEYAGCKDKKSKEVIGAWKEYYDILNNPNSVPSESWHVRADDLFAMLLLKMSSYLGYPFNMISLKRNHYSPVAHGDLIQLQKTFNEFFRDVASGIKAFPIEIRESPNKSDLSSC